MLCSGRTLRTPRPENFPNLLGRETHRYSFMDNGNITWFINNKTETRFYIRTFDISIFNYPGVEIYQFYDGINSILSGVVVRAPPGLEGLRRSPAVCI